MKHTFCTFILSIFSLNTFSQNTSVELLYNWSDDSLVGSAAYDNTYNEIWGLVQNDKEYAVIGTTDGTHIFDVTNPENSEQVAYVAGAVQGETIIHRDYHDYSGYLYAVADEGSESTLQIIDVSNLPDVEVVYDSQELFRMSHNIFIDTSTAKLYVCSPKLINGSSNLHIYSLEDPTNPQFLLAYETLYKAHDIYVRDDIAYINCGAEGFYIVDFNDTENPEILGELTEYSAFGQGYNHSGWVSDNGNWYAMLDEDHGVPIKIVDISNPSDINVLSTLDSGINEGSIPHNAMWKGDYLFVSYYYDGLQIFDVSNPFSPQKIREYDTSSIPHRDSYEGAWGVYSYLPSGNILLSDMQEGLFVLDPNLEEEELGIEENNDGFTVYPTIFDKKITISNNTSFIENTDIQLVDVGGKVIFSQKNITLSNHTPINFPVNLPKGIYYLQLNPHYQKVKTFQLIKK